MALTAGTLLIFDVGPAGNLNAQPVKAAAQIWRGSAVGIIAANGYARALVAADTFAGFSEQDVLGTTDGALTVPVVATGRVQLTVSGVLITSTGSNVYASDDGTFTMTSSGNSLVGMVYRWVSTGVAIVAFDVTNQ